MSELVGIVDNLTSKTVTLSMADGTRRDFIRPNQRSVYGLRSGLAIRLTYANTNAERWTPEYPGAALAHRALMSVVGATDGEAAAILRHFPQLIEDVFRGDLAQPLTIHALAVRRQLEDEAWRQRILHVLTAYVYAIGPVFASLLVDEARTVGIDLDWGVALQINEAFDIHEPSIAPAQRLQRFRANPWLPYLYRVHFRTADDDTACHQLVTALADAYQQQGFIPDFDTCQTLGLLARAVNHRLEQGHSYSGFAVVQTARELSRLRGTKVTPADIYAVIRHTDDGQRLFSQQKDMPERTPQGIQKRSALTFTALYMAEHTAAQFVGSRIGTFVPPLPIPSSSLDAEQQAAARKISQEAFTVLTGPAGSGKTFLLGHLVRTVAQAGGRVALTATTGIAAQRLAAATDPRLTGTTLHSFIGLVPGVARLHPPASSLEPYDLLVVDEASMMDSLLMGKLAYFLMDRNPNIAHICLAGDAGQLPPVSPGKPFYDLLDNLPDECVARLNQSHRTAHNDLIMIARAIADGVPLLEAVGLDSAQRPHVAVQTITQADAVLSCVRQLAEELHCDPQEIGVISPQYGGPLGVDALNAVMRRAFNPLAGNGFSQGDRVIQLRNRTINTPDPDTVASVWNGMIGTAQAPQNGILTVAFPQVTAVYPIEQAERDLAFAWALSVHKSQGGQYPGVVVVLPQDFPDNRELLYTALTRAQQRLIIARAPDAPHARQPLTPRTPERLGFFASRLRKFLPSSSLVL